VAPEDSLDQRRARPGHAEHERRRLVVATELPLLREVLLREAGDEAAHALFELSRIEGAPEAATNPVGEDKVFHRAGVVSKVVLRLPGRKVERALCLLRQVSVLEAERDAVDDGPLSLRDSPRRHDPVMRSRVVGGALESLLESFPGFLEASALREKNSE